MTEARSPRGSSAPSVEEEVAWRELVSRLRGFVRRRVTDPADADDVLGDVLLRIHERADTLHDHDRLLPWVFQVTRNAIIDHYRRTARAREQPVDTLTDLVDADAEPVGGPADEVRAELAACLAPVLARLPVEQQEAIRLVEVEGLTQRDAAERVGISVPGMKSRVQRARSRIGANLDRCCEFTLDARGAPIAMRKRPGTPGLADG